MELHYLNDSRAMRVVWLLEELDLACDIIHYQRHRRSHRAPPALQAIHPLGKSPVLIDEGRTWAESAVILTYLARRYGPQWLPEAGTQADWANQYWGHFAEGSLMPQLMLRLVVQKLGPLAWPIKAMVAEQLRRHLDYGEQALGQQAWFLGEMISVADVMMSVPVALAVKRAGLSAQSHPNLWRWWQHVQARPAYQRALGKGQA